MAMALWQTLKDSITTFTSVSPATFFTVVPVTIACYYLVFVVFGSSSAAGNRYQRAGHVAAEMQLPPLPPPVQVGEITEEELKEYDGSDPKKPLLMAIKGQIYDVSLSRMFYGPGGPYALFAGRDASRALAKMSFEEKDLTGDISGLGPFELEALQDWEYKFKSKYMKVGTVKKTVLVNGESSSPGQPLARTNEDVLEPPMEGGSMVEPEAVGEEKGE